MLVSSVFSALGSSASAAGFALSSSSADDDADSRAAAAAAPYLFPMVHCRRSETASQTRLKTLDQSANLCSFLST